MTSHGPRNISILICTTYRIIYQAEYRTNTSFFNEDPPRAPIFQAKA